MPQLDFLTFCIQIALILFFSWNVQNYFVSKILPSYLSYNQPRKMLWEHIESFSIRYKFYSTLTFLHVLNIFTKQVKSMGLIISTSNLFTGFFSRVFLKTFLKPFRKIGTSKNIFIKIFLYNSIFFSKINSLNISGQKNKLNFLILKNSTYSFVQKYLVNLFLKKKYYKRIMIREFRVCYLLNQIIALRNKVNSSNNTSNLNLIFKDL